MVNILVVEDDKHTRNLLETILKREGYSVLKAEDGIKAMEVLDNHHVDLIILDIMMPNMDGYEFAQELREADCMIPILMATAKQLPEDKKERIHSRNRWLYDKTYRYRGNAFKN